MSLRRAVIIGVNDYRAHDVASHEAPGTSDLRGSVHDAATVFRLLDRLGYGADAMEVCTSPTLTAGEVGADTLQAAPATSGEIQCALAGLVDACAADGTDDAVAVVFFSGHGAFTDADGGVVYPTDYSDAHPERAIRLSDFLAQMKERAPLATVYLWVDACRGGESTLSSGYGQPLNPEPDRAVLLTSCGVGQESFERCIDGRWQGLLAWSLRTVTDQWTVDGQGGANLYLTLSNAELRERCEAAMASISGRDEAQHPALVTSDDNAARAVGHVSVGGTGVTSSNPNGPADAREFPVDTNVLLSAVGSSIGVFDATDLLWYYASTSPFQGVSTVKVTVNPDLSGIDYKSWPTQVAGTSGPMVETSKSKPDTGGKEFANNGQNRAMYASNSNVLTWWRLSSSGNSEVYMASSGSFTVKTSNEPMAAGSGQSWYTD
jgi:hypothetical protein